VAPFEAVDAVGGVLDVPPMAAALNLHALDDKLVPTTPPLRHELRVGECSPHALTRRVEHALHTNFAIARGGYGRGAGGVSHGRAHDCAPLVRSRNSPRLSRRASCIVRECAAPGASFSR